MDYVSLALCVRDDVVYGVGVRCDSSGEASELLLVRVEWCPSAFDEGHNLGGSALRDGNGDQRGEVVHVEGGSRHGPRCSGGPAEMKVSGWCNTTQRRHRWDMSLMLRRIRRWYKVMLPPLESISLKLGDE